MQYLYYVLLSIPHYCICITSTRYHLHGTDVSAPRTATILSEIAGVGGVGECGGACARNTQCQGFISNKARQECKLLLFNNTVDTVLSHQAGSNLYLNTIVECVTNQDCGDRGCHQGTCVDKCQAFQMVTNNGTCKTTWQFLMPKQPWHSIFLPWIFIKASFLHGFVFDDECEPDNKCSLLITNQNIPNMMYEVWPLQGSEWPVKEGLVFRYMESGFLHIFLIQNYLIQTSALDRISFTGSLTFSFDIIENSNKIKIRSGEYEHDIDITVNFDTFWLTTFHEDPDTSRWFSIEDPDMTSLVGFTKCEGQCTGDFSWDLARNLKNTIIGEPLEPDDIIQWYQLPYNKNWNSLEWDKTQGGMEPTEYNVKARGVVVFELKLEDAEEIVVHGSERTYFAGALNGTSTDFKTNFTSIESALKIR